MSDNYTGMPQGVTSLTLAFHTLASLRSRLEVGILQHLRHESGDR